MLAASLDGTVCSLFIIMGSKAVLSLFLSYFLFVAAIIRSSVHAACESVGDVAEYWGPGSFVTEVAVPGPLSFV